MMRLQSCDVLDKGVARKPSSNAPHFYFTHHYDNSAPPTRETGGDATYTDDFVSFSASEEEINTVCGLRK
jgi:hypothetical protein